MMETTLILLSSEVSGLELLPLLFNKLTLAVGIVGMVLFLGRIHKARVLP